MWLLWQLLSNQKKLADNNFEYRLIIEYKDKPLIYININTKTLDSKHDVWLHIVNTIAKAPLNNSDMANKDKFALRLSGFIDLDRILQLEPSLSHIYLWASASLKSESIYLETLHYEATSSLKEPNLRTLRANKNFVELYPVSCKNQPSKRYSQIEDQRIDSEGFQDLLAIIRGEEENSLDVSVIEDKSATNSDPLAVVSKNTIQKVFSKQDLKDLVDGFNDWQRAHGQNELVDKLPESLISKMGNAYQIAFWTSGQGVSNMVRDDSPPRHTMVLGIIQKSSQKGVGYCIQRPTSLDKIWQHKKWHDLKYSDTEIIEVSAIDF